MEEVPDFITNNKWPSGSPNLSPFDYLLWNYLKIVRACWHTNLATLKARIVEATQQIRLKTICESIDDWPRRSHERRGAKEGVILNDYHFIFYEIQPSSSTIQQFHEFWPITFWKIKTRKNIRIYGYTM